MADHIAEQIMSEIGTQITGLTTTGTRVTRSRVFALEGSNGLSYEMGLDTPVPESDQNLVFIDQRLEVRITAHSLNANVETELNQIRKEVTIALMDDYTVNGLATDIEEEGWQTPDVTGDGSEVAGRMEGTFIVKYRRSRSDPSTV